ncbi:hypothetical protein JTB14_013790 [Gonioctena quinquepunctata]|nr:hypothetical protein JTB14_013790 [Gonioctena quinquepunctata]
MCDVNDSMHSRGIFSCIVNPSHIDWRDTKTVVPQEDNSEDDNDILEFSNNEEDVQGNEFSNSCNITEDNLEAEDISGFFNDEDDVQGNQFANKCNITEDHNFCNPLFIPPDNLSVDAKIIFINQHPIQPCTRLKGVNFSKVYHRDWEKQNPVHRKWLSINIKTDTVLANWAICMAFSDDRQQPWVIGSKINMNNFYSRIEKHEVSSAHKISVDAYLIAKSSASITNSMDDKKQKDVELRRQIVSRIIQVIIFLAKQDLAFRSHRNEGASAF